MMGTHITVEIVDAAPVENAIEKVFSYFDYVDNKFSTYKDSSEISKINRGEINESGYSHDMKEVFALCAKTKKETNGYFDIVAKNGLYDPSGIVKGWSIYNASQILLRDGFKNLYIDAGGDIQVYGHNAKNEEWSVGIKNPFNQKEIVKVIYLKDKGAATSGTYIRGQHIYNPFKMDEPILEIVSLTVIGPNVYEADRFATAAFAMGKKGIAFIEELKNFEGYMIDNKGIATMTSGFEKYTKHNA